MNLTLLFYYLGLIILLIHALSNYLTAIVFISLIMTNFFIKSIYHSDNQYRECLSAVQHSFNPQKLSRIKIFLLRMEEHFSTFLLHLKIFYYIKSNQLALLHAV